MKLTVSSKNEFTIIPDIADNLEKPSEEQFKIIFKKLSGLSDNAWTKIDSKTQSISVELGLKYKQQIIRIENPPILSIDGEIEEELTIDIMLSDKYPELFELQSIIIKEITAIEEKKGIEAKK